MTINSHLKAALLFSAVALFHHVSPSFTVQRQQNDILANKSSECHKYNALGDYDFIAKGIRCMCKNGAGGFNVVYHALLKDKKPYCYSSSDFGKLVHTCNSFLLSSKRMNILLEDGGIAFLYHLYQEKIKVFQRSHNYGCFIYVNNKYTGCIHFWYCFMECLVLPW